MKTVTLNAATVHACHSEQLGFRASFGAVAGNTQADPMGALPMEFANEYRLESPTKVYPLSAELAEQWGVPYCGDDAANKERVKIVRDRLAIENTFREAGSKEFPINKQGDKATFASAADRARQLWCLTPLIDACLGDLLKLTDSQILESEAAKMLQAGAIGSTRRSTALPGIAVAQDKAGTKNGLDWVYIPIAKPDSVGKDVIARLEDNRELAGKAGQTLADYVSAGILVMSDPAFGVWNESDMMHNFGISRGVAQRAFGWCRLGRKFKQLNIAKRVQLPKLVKDKKTNRFPYNPFTSAIPVESVNDGFDLLQLWGFDKIPQSKGKDTDDKTDADMRAILGCLTPVKDETPEAAKLRETYLDRIIESASTEPLPEGQTRVEPPTVEERDLYAKAYVRGQGARDARQVEAYIAQLVAGKKNASKQVAASALSEEARALPDSSPVASLLKSSANGDEKGLKASIAVVQERLENADNVLKERDALALQVASVESLQAEIDQLRIDIATEQSVVARLSALLKEVMDERDQLQEQVKQLTGPRKAKSVK